MLWMNLAKFFYRGNMKAQKILFINSEMTPFVAESADAAFGLDLPQQIQECGHEIRIFTPKWGMINERRNQLHEVIRLSGMNIIVDETDRPLIIKVASVASARVQVYFIDNDDYFSRRLMARDDAGVEYDDNGERAIFFARGVLETVKKLRWVPDVIHCHGWMPAFAPLYIKKAYMDEPSFANVKVVYSVSSPSLATKFDKHTLDCVNFKGTSGKDYADIATDDFSHVELMKMAAKYSDGIILDDKQVDPSIVGYAKSLNIPVLDFQGEDFKDAYSEFYDQIMGGEN